MNLRVQGLTEENAFLKNGRNSKTSSTTPSHDIGRSIGQVFEKALNNEWSIRMKDLFYRSIKLKKELATDDYLHPPPEVAAFNAKLDELLKVDYSHVSSGYRNKDKKWAERFAIIRSMIDTAIKKRTIGIRRTMPHS